MAKNWVKDNETGREVSHVYRNKSRDWPHSDDGDTVGLAARR